jgi:uncharacterized protein YecE (DUF72 family)
MKFGQVDDMDLVDFKLPIIGEETKTILSNLKTPNNLSFYFGAPGWSDQKFKGLIYPAKTPAKNFLLEYSKQFNSIEVNSTRYGTPKENVIQKWYETVNENFKFSMKVPQVITHRKDINDYTSKIKMDEFLTAIYNLGHKSGISFAVMAKYFDASKFEELTLFVNSWPNDIPLAIEFRNASWFTLDNIKKWQNLFHEKNIIPVITDTPGRRDVTHFNLVNNHLFVRYVGDFNHPSDLLRINLWTEKVKEFVSLGINNVWFYVHQPGENRERILSFYNTLIPNMNKILNINIPLLKNYSLT